MKILRQKMMIIPFLVLIYFIAPSIYCPDTPAYASEATQEKKLDKNKLVFLSASELANKIKSREVTSLEVVEAHLQHIAKYNPELNAIVTLDAAGARKLAAEADQALMRGEVWGPLHGVPMTIKDNIATKGMKTTSSFPQFANFIPEDDAPLVASLRKAGAIILGKTNMPSLGMDYQTNSPIFGITNNPWDLTRTPGGSTGGGAAAVAAGLSPLEIGNDYGGSIRIPSHFCGIYGIKPTEKMISNSGLMPQPKEYKIKPPQYMLSNGILSRSIDDLILCLGIVADPAMKSMMPSSNSYKNEPKKLNIAWTDDFGYTPVTEDTKLALKQLADKLSGMEYQVKKINPPDFDFMTAGKIYEKIRSIQATPYPPGVSEKLLKAVLEERNNYIKKIDDYLAEYDVFLCPVHPTAAFKHIKPDNSSSIVLNYTTPIMVDDKPFDYWKANRAYSKVFNLTGSPVVVIPIGYTKDGLPIGVQIVGKHWHDRELLNYAKQIDLAAKAYRRPPGY